MFFFFFLRATLFLGGWGNTQGGSFSLCFLSSFFFLARSVSTPAYQRRFFSLLFFLFFALSTSPFSSSSFSSSRKCVLHDLCTHLSIFLFFSGRKPLLFFVFVFALFFIAHIKSVKADSMSERNKNKTNKTKKDCVLYQLPYSVQKKYRK